MRNKKYLILGLRWILGGVFVYASLYKILSPADFAQQIYNYKFLPTWTINPMAIVVPWLQLLCGIGLILNKGTEAASFLILLMMVAFQIALGSALIRGLNVACGCFDAGGSPATWWTFGRDTLFLLFAGLIFYSSCHPDGSQDPQ